MSLTKRSLSPTRPSSRWFEQLMALIIVVNLGLVFLDMSYIPWRDFYLRSIPTWTEWYGQQFKGIEPHRDTQAYLEEVDRLRDQVGKTGLRSPEATILMDDLAAFSHKIIDENPFELAGKTGRLERIKNEMRDRLQLPSAKDAFTAFWNPDYLEQAGWQQEMAFFDRRIRSQLVTNYYRGTDENGQLIDRFWRIDLPFVALFWLEYLTRTFVLSRRYRGVSWLDTMLWRWYDLPLLLPFWQWLRVIPAILRLNESQLVNLEPIRTRIIHKTVTGISTELSEVVVLRVIDQLQITLEDGTLERWLTRTESKRRYVDLNGVDEVEAIADRLIAIAAQEVLPKVKPDLHQLVKHTLDRAMEQSTLYQGMQRIPGFNQFPSQVTTQLAGEVTNTLETILVAYLSDPEAIRLTRRLVDNLNRGFWVSLQQQHTAEEIVGLVNELLNEVKLNYIARLSNIDLYTQIAENNRLYETVRMNTINKSANRL